MVNATTIACRVLGQLTNLFVMDHEFEIDPIVTKYVREEPLTAEEAIAVLDAWQHTGRIVTVGVQSMADGVWMKAFDIIRTGGIGHVAHAQGGVFRNDIRGQWRSGQHCPDGCRQSPYAFFNAIRRLDAEAEAHLVAFAGGWGAAVAEFAGDVR